MGLLFGFAGSHTYLKSGQVALPPRITYFGIKKTTTHENSVSAAQMTFIVLRNQSSFDGSTLNNFSSDKKHNLYLAG